MEVDIKEIETTNDNKLDKQKISFAKSCKSLLTNDDQDNSFKKSLSEELSCSMRNVHETKHQQSSSIEQCKKMQNCLSVPLSDITEQKSLSTMVNRDLPTSKNTNDVNNEMNDDDPVYSDTTFSTSIITISPQHQPGTTFTFTHTDFLEDNQNLEQSNNNTSALLNTFGPKCSKLTEWIKSTGSIQDEQSNNKNKNNNNNPKHMHYAATANNLIFAYGRGKKCRNTLNGITIKVPVGTIYAILGPSGCGKTTLVHSLVGSIKPKSGYVKVFGEIPGSARSLVPGPGVGYMPQEIGLFDEFTIKETLFFFGRLYRLPQDNIRNRIAFLISFLELPDKDCFVGKLSGGQKRRVSLAAALVHKPPLLVLDEPTVGIDPVLRQSIWKHLRSLSSQDGITVIITTHYIDEAQYANTVAFMRHGSLLEEGNPQELITRFQMNNLEEVFLALCHNLNATNEKKDFIENSNEKKWTGCEKPLLAYSQKNYNEELKCMKNIDAPITAVESIQSNQTETNVSNSSEQLFKSTSSTSDNRTKNYQVTESLTQTQRLLIKRNKILDHFARSSALLTKNFIRMWRNLPVMLFASLIPVLQCTLFFLCLGRNPYNIPVSVYNGELTWTKNSSTKYLYSLDLLKEIDNHTIHLSYVDSLEQGFASVRSGQSKALLVFGENFTRATTEKALDLISLDKQVLEQSFVDLYLDQSSQFHVMKIKEKIFEAYHRFSQKLLIENGYHPELADSPIRIPSPLMGNQDPTVTEFMAPGFIMSLSFYASIATAALTLVLERKDGLLERSLVSGVYPNEYIISHVITQTVIVIFQIILVLLMTFFIFHIPNRGPVFWISVLIVMQGVCGMAYGILISAIAKEENFTLAACMGSMFPQFLLSGVVWPVDTMPQFLTYVSTFVSQAKAIDAVRFMLYRGWDPFNHWDVAIGFIITASWTVVFLFIATILFNINKS